MKTSPRPWTMGDPYTGIIKDANRKAVVDLGDDGGCSDPECCGGPSFHIDASASDLLLIVTAVNAYKGPLAEDEQ